MFIKFHGQRRGTSASVRIKYESYLKSLLLIKFHFSEHFFGKIVFLLFLVWIQVNEGN